MLRGVENGNKVLVNDPNDSEAKNYINRSFDMASEVDITSDANFIFESTGPSTKLCCGLISCRDKTEKGGLNV